MRSKADLGEGNVSVCTINRRRPTARAPSKRWRLRTFADLHRRVVNVREHLG
jgi:hypothetical protein